ncbi:MAG TPA: hypothetical protein VFA44_09835 [Gaiellaceae bacterium]|nr:hypothetical protein [Gaiellaceae bacterium]
MAERAVELARQHWAEGHRRLLEANTREPACHARLLDQVEIVTEELRRRIGKSFTIAELAELYAHADRWTQEVIAERGAGPAWNASAATAADAAFHLYARGARDYAP